MNELIRILMKATGREFAIYAAFIILITAALIYGDKIGNGTISIIMAYAGIIFGIIFFIILLYTYMQNARRESIKTRAVYTMTGISSIDGGGGRYIDQERRLRDIESHMGKFIERFNSFERAAKNLEDGIPKEIVESLVDEIKKISADSISSELADRIGKSSVFDKYIGQIRLICRSAISSLEEEIDSLNSRSNLQIASGATISVIGFLVLGYFIYSAEGAPKTSNLDLSPMSYIILRAGLVLLIELFALFFLRMYRYSVFEIKYFQNEISNIYMKSIAVEMAFSSGDEKLFSQLSKELISAERNIIMRKGDISLSQLRDIAERDGDAVLVNFVKSIPESLAGLYRQQRIK
ncbi:hypothetical protein [Nitrospirillum sp. BR 11828]|uniref:hypothetical protein n=1 Tax=Nitrospirillum sp. BR 11828 TaxID=3104325 RepID=UPI002ACA8598|nr:hypothetical protein [Nitrospirillum sp. BR 11828]MDZ5647372.1 hypothetical protein [Nitrospirillum sp. BR 11828]